MIGLIQPGTGLGMRERTIGWRKTVPPKIFRIWIDPRSDHWQREESRDALTVPFGLFHISFSLNSLTRSSSGVMVAHFMPTLCFKMAFAASMVTWSFVFL